MGTAEGDETFELTIRVRPSPATNDHEVVLLGNGDNLVDRFGDKSIGLDPDDLLVNPCPLLEADPRGCLIGRCDCGVIGCGDVQVRIAFHQGIVAWSSPVDEPVRVYFEERAYRREVQRALDDHSWETPERTASRLVRTGVDSEHLHRHGLEFSWASGRAARHFLTVAFRLQPGPYQVLVRIPSNPKEEPRQIAERALSVLARAPSSWPNVEWSSQGETFDPPSLAGPGWRRWRP